MELKGSRTEADLATAFAGESEARNRYDFYAKKAKEDGYEQIAALFDGDREATRRQHAKIWFRLLHERQAFRDTAAKTCRPPPRARTTSGPRCTRSFAEDAKAEGFERISCALLNRWRKSRRTHEERYRKLLSRSWRTASVFTKDGERGLDLPQLRTHPHGKGSPGPSARSARTRRRISS